MPLLCIFFFGLSTAAYCGDPIGKIFTKAEANQKFGKVVTSVTMSVKEVRALIAVNDEHVMFNIKGNRVRALSGKRTMLNAAAADAQPTEVFHKYSRSKVEELLSLTTTDTVTFEQRTDVFSVTSGDYTLENSWLCPPSCTE